MDEDRGEQSGRSRGVKMDQGRGSVKGWVRKRIFDGERKRCTRCSMPRLSNWSAAV